MATIDNFQYQIDRVTQDFKRHLSTTGTTMELINTKKDRINNILYLSKLPQIDFNERLCNKNLFDFIENFYKNNLYITSYKSGICKTLSTIHFATKYYINNFKYVLYYSSPELLRKINSEQFHKNSTDLITDLKRIDLLIIDDLGKERITESSCSTIFEIIDYRYLNNKITWITSNYAAAELKEKFFDYGDAIARRIKDKYEIYAE